VQIPTEKIPSINLKIVAVDAHEAGSWANFRSGKHEFSYRSLSLFKPITRHFEIHSADVPPMFI